MCSNNKSFMCSNKILFKQNHEKKISEVEETPVTSSLLICSEYCCGKRPLTSLTTRLVVTLFSGIFTGDGATGYKGCDSTETDQRLEQRP